MNKQFMYVNGNIVISDENGIKPIIPYVDNIEDLLILENEIEYLEFCLVEDQEKLEAKKKDRAYRNKDSLKISIVGSLFGVGAAFGVGHLAGLSHEEMTNTIMGPMSEYLAYTIPMSVGCVGFAQMLSLLGLSYRPFKGDIRGLEEKIEYEKEMIKIFKEELDYLRKNSTCNRKDQVEDMIAYDIHYKYSLDYLKESLKLRYAFGYNEEKFIKLHNEGEFSQRLRTDGYSDDVVLEFIGFLERKLREKEVEAKLSNK